MGDGRSPVVAELTDGELEYLARIVAWEVAIRTSSEYFTESNLVTASQLLS